VTTTSADGSGAAGSGLAPRQIHILMIAVMTGMFLAALDGTIVHTALPEIVGELGNLTQAPWLTVGYLLTQTIATPIVGKLSDLFGRKSTFQASIVIFIVASLLAAAAQDMPQLVAFRALQGIGAGGLLALPMAIVGDLLPPRERARYQGYISGTFTLAALLGPLAGGFFVDYLNWRWVFLINLPIGLVSMAVVQRHLHIDRAPTRRAIDYWGAVTLTAATTPLVVSLLWAGGRWGWTGTPTLALFAIAAVATGFFLLVERRAAEPMLPLSLFSNPVVRATLIGGFTTGIAMYAMNSYIPIFLQVVNGTTATVSGLLSLPTMIGVTIGSIASGQAIARTGDYKPYPILGVALMGVGGVLLGTMDVHTSTTGVAVRLFITGLGMGQIGPSLTIIVQNAVPYRDLGVATAGLSFIRTLGGSIGSAVLGAVYANRVDTLIPRYVGADAMASLPDPDQLRGRPSVIRELPQPVRGQVANAFADAVTTSVRVVIPVLVVTLVIFVFIPRIPLRQGHGESTSPGERP
jgi:EmrB/QacA subfamily drug resistance transporter